MLLVRMGISGLRWSLFLLVTSQVVTFGGCTSGKSGGSDGAAGSGGGSGAGGGGGGSAGGAAGGSSGAGGAGAATMFLSDGISSAVYRYALRPGVDPVLNDTITVTAPGGTGTQQTATGMAMSPAGELFVADFSTGAIFRVLSPLGTPATNGSAVVSGIGNPEEIRFVDDELWVPNVTSACSTTPESIVRVGFDVQGNASLAGTVTAGSIGANRGMLWVAATRDLYIGQCDPVDAIQHYRVAADHSATALTPLTGNGLYNPHGMVLTPWGELIVANAGQAVSPGMSLLRFTLDAQGNATPNGTISGNGLDFPIGLAFAPWGELFAVNQGTATLSRFTFDSVHAAVPNGTFVIPGPTVAEQGGLGWILIVPGASFAVDGGATDSAADAASD
jgi:hypothetical protein